ncbi:MAG: acyl-CoA mutase large subunit family protein [Desulfatibacillum sp.]|nr:acyl-CoA mutase large subunit family protein [Desulfatibacillum sp.]
MSNNAPTLSPKGEGEKLFSEFSFPSYQEWYDAAVASLKGAPFEKKVITKTYEDIDLQPMYWQQEIKDLPHIDTMPGSAPFVRGTKAEGFLIHPWTICQAISCSSPEEFNKAALHDLEKGQTGLQVVLDPPTKRGQAPGQAKAEEVGAMGLSAACAGDFATAMAGVDTANIPLFLNAGAVALPVASLIAAGQLCTGKFAASLAGCVGADPLGELAAEGSIPVSLAGAYDSMAALLMWAKSNARHVRTIIASGSPYHDAGASATQELAFAMATAAEYIRAMQARGEDIDVIAPKICFSFSVGGHFFMEISKLRAARVLWAQIVEAFGGNEESQKMFMFARTSAWTKTLCDPYVNMLRNTTECFAAAMGSADMVYVAPFDELARQPNEFSRRVSRNAQIVLQEECRFTQPVDASGGSWFVEVLTDKVAEKAWGIFQEVEKAGGMAKALEQGLPQSMCADVAGKKASNIKKRKDVLVGTNMYANLTEKVLDVPTVDHAALKSQRAAQVEAFCKEAGNGGDMLKTLAQAMQEAPAAPETMDKAVAAAQAGASLSAIMGTMDTTPATVTPLNIHRGAELFESLRTAMDRHVAKTGGRVKIFLANMGPIPQHKGRADFAQGFFIPGGFEIVDNTGFQTPEDCARAFADSGAEIAIICSTDKAYPEIVPPLAKLLKEKVSGATVLLAGKPAKDLEQSYRDAGMDDYIFLGADCHALLLTLQKRSGLTHE